MSYAIIRMMTDLKQLFLIVSAVLPLISPIIYSRAILKGRAKPHRTTRLTLLIIASIATVSLFAQHDTVAIWLAGVSALQAVVIFVLSIKYGMGGWAKTDIICLVIALFGIFLWQTTKNPTLTLYSSIAADFTGMIPAIIKTYRLPQTEIASFFVIDSVAGIFNLLAVKTWTAHEISYPIYIFAINALMVMLVLKPRLKNRIVV